MTKAEELLACPFCGSIEIERNSDRWGHFFFCECGSRGAYGDTPARACSNWNTRLAAQADAQGGEVVAWQPIETAPMKTPILVYVPGNRPERRVLLCENSDEYGWAICGGAMLLGHPTFWMHKPTPPLSIEAQRAESTPKGGQ